MEEIKPALWTWTAPHPEWTPEAEGWEREVRSYAYDTRDSLVLFDPLVSVEDVEELSHRRSVAVILSCRWHVRSSADLVDRLGATVHAPAATIAELGLDAVPYELGEDLPGDVEPQTGGYSDEATLWLREHAALVTGDVFLGGEEGFCVQPDSWLTEGMSHEELRDRLRPLLELPIEMLLPTHGNPILEGAHATLERALDET
jgi:glyoxylase-like metal-dependent hydrolase (beta-lactamase superfamily II)